MLEIKDKYFKLLSPGFVIKVSKDDKIKSFTYGYKKILPEKEQTQIDTLYDLASLTKTYTSVLAYMAYEEKKIKLDSTVYDIDNHFENLKDITVSNLLSHNQNIWTNGYLGDAKSKEDFYNILYSAYVKDNNPTYVDTHYIILSYLLEKIYQKSFADLCHEKIINKLNLKNTTFFPHKKNTASNNYEHQTNVIIDYIYPGVIHDNKGRRAMQLGIATGHASLFADANDLYVFLKSFFDYSLLKKDTIKLMLDHKDVNKDNYNRLKKTSIGEDINDMYDYCLNHNVDIALPKTYNNMGSRFKNDIIKVNDVPMGASDNSITFSGYTGPMYTIDFDKKIIVVIMCNIIHNTMLNRDERKKLCIELMNDVFEYTNNL